MVLMESNVHERIRASLSETQVSSGRKISFHAMGTRCQIAFVPDSRATGEAFIDATICWVADFEARYSRFIPDSLISQINESAGRDWVEVDEETDRLFSLCQELYFFTRRAFDPTALPLIQLWNWKADPPEIPDDATVSATRELVGWHKVQRRRGAIHLPCEGMSIDLGGIGKEYAVDRVAQLAQEHRIQNALVDFGQDVRVNGQPPGRPAWHIGLEDPKNPGRCWTGVAIRDRAVATSGDYLRKFELNGRRFGHILDPRTGYPVNNGCRAVTVIAPTCTFAGALSTTAFILGEDDGLRMIESCLGAEGCIITDKSRRQTRRFNEYLTQ
jgi:thiamine biosynthesis lipoprotein